MSATPPTGEERKTLVNAPCPVTDCRFVAVVEFDGSNPIEAAMELRDHCNEEHDLWELPEDVFTDVADVGTEGGDD